MASEIAVDKIEKVRQFNRFYTRQIGVLREGLLHSSYSLTEARILFELGHREHITASNLCRELGLDAGYLSRILSRLEQQELIEKVRPETDGRQRLLHLTETGRKAFLLLDQRSQEEISEMLNELGIDEQQRLLKAMHTIESLLTRELKFSRPFFLRSPRSGDMGWVIHRHGVLYTEEYGWNEQFEALVAQIVADFSNHYNPQRERCWIAEREGEIIGSVFLVQSSETAAKLRLLLVEPDARGLGLGTLLVEECIRFARRCGYQKLVLWTNSVLVEARHIYEKTGFQLVEQETHHSFGHDLIGETWELQL